MSHSHDITFPRGAMIGALTLVGFAFASTVAVRTGIIAPQASPAAERVAAGVKPIESRKLRFHDQADGAIAVIDTAPGGGTTMIPAGSNSGFIRGVMRGLARERRLHRVTQDTPFKLTLWDDGELSLEDLATGRKIELGAFGPDNRQSFVKLLQGKFA